MTLTIDSITINNFIAQTDVDLDAGFVERERAIDRSLIIKLPSITGKITRTITFAYIKEADWINLQPKLNSGVYTCTLTGAGSHNFTGDYFVYYESSSPGFNGTRRGAGGGTFSLIFDPQ